MGCESLLTLLDLEKISQSVAKCGFLSSYGKLGPALAGGIFMRDPRIRRFKKIIT